MPEPVRNLNSFREQLIRDGYEQGWAAGRTAKEAEHMEVHEKWHCQRMKVHARWGFRSLACAAGLTLLLISNAVAPLHDFLLCLIGAVAAVALFHLYYWNNHFVA